MAKKKAVKKVEPPVPAAPPAEERKPITIAELMAEMGEDKLTFQFLPQCMIKIELKKHKGVEESHITFITDAITPTHIAQNNAPKLGMVIWLDVEQYNAVKKARGIP